MIIHSYMAWVSFQVKKSKNPIKTRNWVSGSNTNPDFLFVFFFVFLCFFVHVCKQLYMGVLVFLKSVLARATVY